MRRKRKNSGVIPTGTKRCPNCNGAGYRYEKIRDLGGRSGSGVSDTFRVSCDACSGKGYVNKQDIERYYAQWKYNPRRRYRRNSKSKLWKSSTVARMLRRRGHGRFKAVIKKLRKSRHSRTLFPVPPRRGRKNGSGHSKPQKTKQQQRKWVRKTGTKQQRGEKQYDRMLRDWQKGLE